jgi:hypothetical protein
VRIGSARRKGRDSKRNHGSKAGTTVNTVSINMGFEPVREEERRRRPVLKGRRAGIKSNV